MEPKLPMATGNYTTDESGAGAPEAAPTDLNSLVLQAKAYQFLVQTLSNPSQGSLFFPNITDDGNKLLRNAGLDPAQCGQLLDILRLAAFAQVNAEPILSKQNEAQQKLINEAQQKLIEDQTKSAQETNQVVSELKKGLTNNVLATTRAYSRTMWMYIVSFYAGLAMIAAAIVFAWVGKDRWFPLAFGTLGTASTITFFFTKPPEGLQNSRVSLAQLQSALLSWFVDFLNQQIMFQKRSTDIPPITLGEYEQSASNLVERTEKWMKMLHQAVQDVGTANVAGEAQKKQGKQD